MNERKAAETNLLEWEQEHMALEDFYKARF